MNKVQLPDTVGGEACRPADPPRSINCSVALRLKPHLIRGISHNDLIHLWRKGRCGGQMGLRIIASQERYSALKHRHTVFTKLVKSSRTQAISRDKTRPLTYGTVYFLKLILQAVRFLII